MSSLVSIVEVLVLARVYCAICYQTTSYHWPSLSTMSHVDWWCIFPPSDAGHNSKQDELFIELPFHVPQTIYCFVATSTSSTWCQPQDGQVWFWVAVLWNHFLLKGGETTEIVGKNKSSTLKLLHFPSSRNVSFYEYLHLLFTQQ